MQRAQNIPNESHWKAFRHPNSRRWGLLKSHSEVASPASREWWTEECFLRGWHHLPQHAWGKKPDNDAIEEWIKCVSDASKEDETGVLWCCW